METTNTIIFDLSPRQPIAWHEFDRALEMLGWPVSMKSRLVHIVAECMQNIVQHGSPSRTVSYVSVEMGESSALVTTANTIDDTAVPYLKHKLDLLNNMSPVLLKTLYQQTLVNGEWSARGTAGLGLISIARKASGPLQYSFTQNGPGQSVFKFSAEVRPE